MYKRCLEVLDHSLTKALVFSAGFLMCLDNKVSYAVLTALVYWSIVIKCKGKKMGKSIYLIVDCMDEYKCFILEGQFAYTYDYPAFYELEKAEEYLKKIKEKREYCTAEILEVNII